MDAEITLTTSDDPLVSLTVSRSALVAHSKVFADMLTLDLKSDNGHESVPLSEHEYQLKPLLILIAGTEEERQQTVSGLDENGWINLAKLADKYDCWAGTQSRRREYMSTPKLAFALATICHNKKLIQATARPVVLLSDLEAYPHITSEWRLRLAAWKGAQLDKIMKLMSTYATHRPYHNGGTCNLDECDGEKCWNRLVGRALQHYNLDHSPPIPVRNELLHVSMNGRSMGNFAEQAAKFEKEISEWIEFPV